MIVLAELQDWMHGGAACAGKRWRSASRRCPRRPTWDATSARSRGSWSPARRAGVALLVFPECALTGYAPAFHKSSAGFDPDAVEAAVEEVRALARKSRLALVLGTHLPLDGGWSNSALLIGPDGRIAGALRQGAPLRAGRGVLPGRPRDARGEDRLRRNGRHADLLRPAVPRSLPLAGAAAGRTDHRPLVPPRQEADVEAARHRGPRPQPGGGKRPVRPLRQRGRPRSRTSRA